MGLIVKLELLSTKIFTFGNYKNSVQKEILILFPYNLKERGIKMLKIL